MTREKAKELLPIIQAFVEGKTIQVWANDIWQDEESPLFWAYAQFRIKPGQKSEPKYRPFKTQEECWNEMHKHPDFGWVMNRCKDYLNVTEIFIDGIRFTLYDIGDGHSMPEAYNFAQAFSLFTFSDGTPFGINEE